MRDHIDFGAKGEDVAYHHLIQNGFQILERNFRTKYGEIDIIAQKDQTLHFVEIKTRKTTRYGVPELAVTKKKQKTIRKVASFYLLQKGIQHKFHCFDVMALLINKSGVTINHIQNAF